MAKQWTYEMDAALITMHGTGVTAKQIGSVLGRTPGAVGQRAFHLGITKKRSDSLPSAIHAANHSIRTALPVYEDEVNADVLREWEDNPEIPRRFPKTKPKPTWLKAMMWWRN